MISGPFLVDLGPVRVDFSSVDFGVVFDPHFHGSFSVGDRPGNCLFHWVFLGIGPLF